MSEVPLYEVGLRYHDSDPRHAAIGHIQLLEDSGLRVEGSGFAVQGLGCGVWGLGCRVQGSGFRFQG